MAAINQPARAPTQLDAISAVLNIGQTLYGIKANNDKLKQDQEQFALDKQLKESQLGMAKQEAAEKTRKSQGQYTPNEIASIALDKDFTVSNSPLANAIKLTQVSPDGKSQDVFLSKRVDEGKSLDLQNKKLQNQKLLAELNKVKSENPAIAKKFTDDQFKAGIFGARAEQAEADLNKVMETYDPTNTFAVALDSKFPKSTESPAYKNFKQAQKNFITAILRKESGAVIGPEEMADASEQYFPQPGDTPENLEQKARNRLLATQGLRAQAAGAYDLVKSSYETALASKGVGEVKNKNSESSSVFSSAIAKEQSKAKFDPSKPFKVIK